MADRVHVNRESPNDLGEIDRDDFGRQVRRFALDAHRLLGRSDSPIDEVIRLHRRVWCLLHAATAARSSGIRRWLLAALRAIDARILASSFTGPESWAA
jgi:hypothetical protein